jgi:hypothetical protein
MRMEPTRLVIAMRAAHSWRLERSKPTTFRLTYDVFNSHGRVVRDPGRLRQFAAMDSFSPNSMRCYPVGFRTAGVELVPLVEIEPPMRDAGTQPFKKYKMMSLLMALTSPECAIPPIEVVRTPAGGPYRFQVRNGFHRYYLSAAAGFRFLDPR